jgi:hypothetical protein
MRTRGILTFAVGIEYARMAYALYLGTLQFGTEVGFIACVSGREEAEYLRARGVPYEVIPAGTKDQPFWFEQCARDLTPFDLTLKMDADCIIPRGCNLHSVFDMIDERRMVNGVPYTLEGTPAGVSPYRKQDEERGLPPVYSTMFGFSIGTMSSLFFSHVKTFYRLWGSDYLPMTKDLPLTTDSVYSMAWLATKPMGCALHGAPFHHMKPGTMGWDNIPDNWSTVMPNHIDQEGRMFVSGTRVGLPCHYQDKTFMTDANLKQLEEVYVSNIFV